MGGLRSAMPLTFATFVIGSLSLAGVFPLAGFWSKDEVLLDAWNHNRFLFFVGSAVAFMTALYMFRAIFMTFFGEYRGGGQPEHGHGGAHAQPHESPWSMALPLLILAVPAVAIGWVNLGSGFGELIEGALPEALREFEFHVEGVVVVTSTLAALLGIGAAGAIYYAGVPAPADLRRAFGPLPAIVERKYYLDFIAETVIVRWLLNGVLGRAAAALDTYVIDGVVNGVGRAVREAGDRARRTEVGQLQAYTSVFFVGLLVAVVAIFVVSGEVLER
jgi:NADH-quinone oxidoreductase subunit L